MDTTPPGAYIASLSRLTLAGWRPRSLSLSLLSSLASSCCHPMCHPRWTIRSTGCLRRLTQPRLTLAAGWLAQSLALSLAVSRWLALALPRSPSLAASHCGAAPHCGGGGDTDRGKHSHSTALRASCWNRGASTTALPSTMALCMPWRHHTGLRREPCTHLTGVQVQP